MFHAETRRVNGRREDARCWEISRVCEWQRDCSASDMPSDTRLDDRRDIEMRDALLDRFRYELQHMPGLALTPDQASRLFGVPRDVCGRLLSRLEQQGEIYLRSDGRFVGLIPTNSK
jgi:hypothetical protein